MHTSALFCWQDFTILTGAGSESSGFADLFPDYHPQDRILFFVPDGMNDIPAVAPAILALTTAFYTELRARNNDFFDYPQHLGLTGATQTATQLEPTWGYLDVWPSNRWLGAARDPVALFRILFDFQINRLFLPDSWAGETVAVSALPGYARRMLVTLLKSVVTYAPAQPTHQLQVANSVRQLIQKGIEAANPQTLPAIPMTPTPYRLLPVSTFLEPFAFVFTND